MRCCFIASVLSVSLFTLGCGDSGPNYQPGGGTVTLDGKPFPKVSLTFIPGNQGPSSVAEADDNGKFVLYGPGNKAGIIPGDYVVVVECPYDPSMGSSEDGTDPGEVAESSGCVVPEDYTMQSTSTLNVTIPPEGNESISLELVSQ